MHKQPVYQNAPAYVNGVSEAIFKVGVCLPAGPMVTDDDVRYIVERDVFCNSVSSVRSVF
jgi:dTDP-4-amino-4,6-dideoxygalactose transaminase